MNNHEKIKNYRNRKGGVTYNKYVNNDKNVIYSKNNTKEPFTKFQIQCIISMIICFLFLISSKLPINDNFKTYINSLITKNIDLKAVFNDKTLDSIQSDLSEGFKYLKSNFNDLSFDNFDDNVDTKLPMPTEELSFIPLNSTKNLATSKNEDASVRNTSADDTAVYDTSADDTSADDTSADDTSADDTSADDTSVRDTSADDTSANDTVEDFINPADGIITSSCGTRTSPISGNYEFHDGIDIGLANDTKLKAVRSGIVTDIRNSSSFGLLLTFETTDGYTIMYAHLNEVLVSKGDNITVGDYIALSGNTGYSTGPHLHYSVKKDGETYDPIQFLDLDYTQNVIDEYADRGVDIYDIYKK